MRLALFFNCAFLLNSVVGRTIDEYEMRALTDAIVAYFPATRISLHSCIDQDNARELSTVLSRRRISHSLLDRLEYFDPLFYDNWEHRNLYALDMRCNYSIDALHRANVNNMFLAPTKWFVLVDNSDGNFSDDFITEIFGNLKIYPDSDVLLAIRSSTDYFYFVSIYRPSVVRDLVLEYRGNWSSIGGLIAKKLTPSSDRRKDLQRTPLKSCLVMTDPDTINHLTDYKNKRIDPVTKATYPWVLHIVNRMNATISFDIENTWGYVSPNGSWSGMIGKLQRKEIDIGGTATFFVSERIHIVEYIQLYARTGSRFIFRQPLLSSVSNIFTLPFEPSVWIAIGLLLLCVMALLYISMKWEYYRGFSEKSIEYWQQFNQSKPTLSDNLLVILGAMAQQGFSYEAYRVPTRIVTLMLLIAALSLYASYTANIVSLLQATTNSIKTLSDLLNSPLKLGVMDVVYNRYYFQVYQDPVRKSISEKVKDVKGKMSNWMNIEEGVKRVRNELFAFHGEMGTVYQVVQDTFLEEEKCGITEIDYMNMLYPLLVIEKRSPYLEIIKVGSMKIWETGLQTREHNRLWTKKPECYGNTNFISIGFSECYFALLIMGYGALITIFIFLLEILWKKKQKLINTEDTEKPIDSVDDEDFDNISN